MGDCDSGSLGIYLTQTHQVVYSLTGVWLFVGQNDAVVSMKIVGEILGWQKK